jgi:hypothetical protein
MKNNRTIILLSFAFASSLASAMESETAEQMKQRRAQEARRNWQWEKMIEAYDNDYDSPQAIDEFNKLKAELQADLQSRIDACKKTQEKKESNL